MSDHPRSERLFALLLAVYVAGHVTANALAAKLITVGGVFTVGALAYPLTYVLQDVLSEVYGEARARWVVLCSFIGCLVLVLFTLVAGAIPEAGVAPLDGCFERVFSVTPRIVLASLSAFLLGGLVDVRLFFLIRKITGARMLWLRKLGSTAIGQGVDSAVFVLIAFAGALPADTLLAMALSQYALKAALAVFGLPFSYAAIKVAR